MNVPRAQQKLLLHPWPSKDKYSVYKDKLSNIHFPQPQKYIRRFLIMFFAKDRLKFSIHLPKVNILAVEIFYGMQNF